MLEQHPAPIGTNTNTKINNKIITEIKINIDTKMYYRFILEVVALWAACYFLPPEPVATGLESCALYDNVFDANASPEIMADLIPTDNFKSMSFLCLILYVQRLTFS